MTIVDDQVNHNSYLEDEHILDNYNQFNTFRL
jgi:hypothetical protein